MSSEGAAGGCGGPHVGEEVRKSAARVGGHHTGRVSGDVLLLPSGLSLSLTHTRQICACLLNMHLICLCVCVGIGVGEHRGQERGHDRTRPR